jgi:hypothetical protein
MSPTAFRVWNLRIVIYPKDHKPAHVHVIGPAAEAKIAIGSWQVIEAWGFSEKAVKQIINELKKRELKLQEIWDDYQE